MRSGRLGLGLFVAAATGLAACDGLEPTFDTSEPKITEGPIVSVTRDTSVTIAWFTNERANSLVEYGLAGEDLDTVEIDNLFLTTHILTIKNLQPETDYQFRALSYDLFGNGPARSSIQDVTTVDELPIPLIVITEIMPSPIDTTTGEFIELYNDGLEAVDLTGFTFTDGDATDTLQGYLGGETVLQPQEYALILDADYIADTYDIPAGTILMTTGDSTLGNGISTDDPITLFSAGASDPSSTYGTPGDPLDAIPITPTTGVSVERLDIGAPDEVGNWCLSTDATDSTPGTTNSGCT